MHNEANVSDFLVSTAYIQVIQLWPFLSNYTFMTDMFCGKSLIGLKALGNVDRFQFGL